MKQFLVHSCQITITEVPAKTVDGLPVIGRMPVAIIELVPVDGIGGTVTETMITPTPADCEVIVGAFPVGGIVERGDYRLIETPAVEK